MMTTVFNILLNISIISAGVWFLIDVVFKQLVQLTKEIIAYVKSKNQVITEETKEDKIKRESIELEEILTANEHTLRNVYIDLIAHPKFKVGKAEENDSKNQIKLDVLTNPEMIEYQLKNLQTEILKNKSFQLMVSVDCPSIIKQVYKDIGLLKSIDIVLDENNNRISTFTYDETIYKSDIIEKFLNLDASIQKHIDDATVTSIIVKFNNNK